MSDDSNNSAWSSSLSTNDFAACLASGYDPAGFVQGVSVISWGWQSPMGSTMGLGMGRSPVSSTQGYVEQYACPHGFVSAEHRMYGMNYEQVWAEEAWRLGYSGAFARLVDEAHRLGAHGVIGLSDRVEHNGELGTVEFALQGTAVRIPGADPVASPFTTFLAGQRLTKLLEAGFAPVSIVAEFVSVQVYASCITEFMLRGSGALGWGQVSPGEITQITRGREASRHLVRERVRASLGSDTLHGAELELRQREVGGSGPQFDALLKGTRVRRFKDYADVPLPRPQVRLIDV